NSKYFCPFDPLTPNGSPLWYFSHVPSYKQTLDLNNKAQARFIRPVGNLLLGCKSAMALSKSIIIESITWFLDVLSARRPFELIFKTLLYHGTFPNFFTNLK